MSEFAVRFEQLAGSTLLCDGAVSKNDDPVENHHGRRLVSRHDAGAANEADAVLKASKNNYDIAHRCGRSPSPSF